MRAVVIIEGDHFQMGSGKLLSLFDDMLQVRENSCLAGVAHPPLGSFEKLIRVRVKQKNTHWLRLHFNPINLIFFNSLTDRFLPYTHENGLSTACSVRN